MSLKHNPFLFTPYQKLCHIGKVPFKNIQFFELSISFFQGSDPDQILDVSSNHQFFDMKDCVTPYKESNVLYDSNLKVKYI